MTMQKSGRKNNDNKMLNVDMQDGNKHKNILKRKGNK